MNWKHLLEYIKAGYYSAFFMQLTSLFVIIAFLLQKKKNKNSIYLIIIVAASLIETIIAEYDILTSKKIFYYKLVGITQAIYLVIEFICCMLFIRANIQSRLVRKIIVSSPILLFSIVAIFPILRKHFRGFAENIGIFTFAIEALVIISMCLYFFYESFTLESNNKQLNQHSIWAISGILIFFSATGPLYTFLYYLFIKDRGLYRELWNINYVAYSIMFVMFALTILKSNGDRLKNPP